MLQRYESLIIYVKIVKQMEDIMEKEHVTAKSEWFRMKELGD